MSTSTRSLRRRIRPVGLAAGLLAMTVALAACGSGSEYFGVRSTAKGAPRSVERKAGMISDGTAVCIINQSSDTFSITITGSEGDQDGYGDVSGTDNFSPRSQLCMKSDTFAASDRALARITTETGERFQLSGFNPSWGGEPWIEVNNDARELGTEATFVFKIGKHPIQARRLADVNGWKFFVARIS